MEAKTAKLVKTVLDSFEEIFKNKEFYGAEDAK